MAEIDRNRAIELLRCDLIELVALVVGSVVDQHRGVCGQIKVRRMTAIGFSGGSHCGREHGALLQKHGATLVINDMRQLANTLPKLTQSAVR